VLVSVTSSIYLNWKLGLALTFVVPFVLGSGIVETKLGEGQNVKKSKGLEKAGNVAIECISNIRTVVSLGREETFHSLYMSHLLEPYQQAKKNSPIRGIIYAVTINASLMASIIAIYYGGYLIAYEQLNYEIVFIINESLIFGIEMIGQMLAFTPNYGKAILAARRIFKIINR